MKRFALYIGLAAAMVASCSTQEKDFQTPPQDDVVFYASFEQPADEGTRVYANEDLLLRWTADDRVSIFGKNTFNQQYKFLGETGDNSGGFSKVDGAEYVTGNPISHTVSVYPYQASTKITEDEVLTVTLPAEQHYAENSFGLGDNPMVSVSADNFLQFKNVGGYLMLKLYGEGVSVSSITLKGNNGEKLAGKANVTMPLEGTPSAMMADDATTTITLTCETPVQLGTSAEESTQFWFVVPPVNFSKGFQITVSGDGGVFENSTEKTVTIERNKLSKMSPIEVKLSQPRNVIYYTSSDGTVVTPYNPDAFGASILSNEYVAGRGTITFDGEVSLIGNNAFRECSLVSMTIPNGVTSIGDGAFLQCYDLSDVIVPGGVTSIGRSAFYFCTSLTSIDIPDSVQSIGSYAFYYCNNLTSIVLPSTLKTIDSYTFYRCKLKEISIPESVVEIGSCAFIYCTELGSVVIPQNVTNIRGSAFYGCSALSQIVVYAINPPEGDAGMFFDTNECPIYVPAESVDVYKSAQYWSDYADRIQALAPIPEAIDMGLSVKWASFNLGATKPEEYGDYYAWGETGPKEDYAWSTYKWCMGANYTLTKYCTDSYYGYNGFTDGKTVLDPEDDAAHVNLGGKWRMPTDDEWTELNENCTWSWTTQNGVNGYLVTGPNGNSIFLPAAGDRGGTNLRNAGSVGFYWSSSLNTGSPYYARCVWFNSLSAGYDYSRCYGQSVRPVSE